MQTQVVELQIGELVQAGKGLAADGAIGVLPLVTITELISQVWIKCMILSQRRKIDTAWNRCIKHRQRGPGVDHIAALERIAAAKLVSVGDAVIDAKRTVVIVAEVWSGPLR